MPVFSLNIHANYACRHSGACCTAGWHIPVEPRLRNLLGGAVLAPDRHGTCQYFDRESRLCRVHRDHGEANLPASCHHFPRRALIDDRGIFVTLSHFCPSAAALLFESEAPLAIVTAPPGFPPTRQYEGLDARGEWAPLVRPGVLFDLNTYSRWEAFIVSTLDRRECVHDALTEIANAAERLREWRLECGTFAEWSAATLEAGLKRPDDRGRLLRIYEPFACVNAYEQICNLVPDGLRAPTVPEAVQISLDHFVDPVLELHAAPIRRYLAAKAVGSWSAYQSTGIRTLVAELVVSELVLRVECARASAAARRPLDRALLVEAVRASDWLLVHLIDHMALTRWLGQVEYT